MASQYAHAWIAGNIVILFQGSWLLFSSLLRNSVFPIIMAGLLEAFIGANHSAVWSLVVFVLLTGDQ